MTLFDAETLVRLRPALAGVPAYVAGKPAPMIEGLITYKCSSNEIPWGPTASVHQAMSEALASANRYPDMNSVALKAAIAEFNGRSADQIAVGAGSSGVLSQIINALCDDGDEVIYAWRSFEAYPILVKLAGAVPVQIPLNAAQEHDLDAMAAAVTERTKLIMLCTPNNPTGPVLTNAEVKAFIDKIPAHIPVLLDEAYREFSTADDTADALTLQTEFPQVIALRTFSKAYGLAGIRIGYSVSHPTLAEAFAKTSIPFSVNSLAQVAAVAALDAVDEMQSRVDAVVAERERVVAGLIEQGWKLPSTQANFVFFPLGDNSEAFDDTCSAAGLVVRRYGNEGVRFTIAETEANDRFLQVAATLLHLQA